MHNRGDVHLHHVEQPLRFHLMKLAVGAETGIVNEQFDG